MRAIAEIRAQQRDGNLSGRQVATIMENAEKYPSRLLAVTERLSLEDALQVWDKAGINERRQLLPLIYSKIAKWRESAATSRKSPGQLQDMRNRIADVRRSLVQ